MELASDGDLELLVKARNQGKSRGLENPGERGLDF
jgi:hypothetical protein